MQARTRHEHKHEHGFGQYKQSKVFVTLFVGRITKAFYYILHSITKDSLFISIFLSQDLWHLTGNFFSRMFTNCLCSRTHTKSKIKNSTMFVNCFCSDLLCTHRLRIMYCKHITMEMYWFLFFYFVPLLWTYVPSLQGIFGISIILKSCNDNRIENSQKYAKLHTLKSILHRNFCSIRRLSRYFKCS